MRRPGRDAKRTAKATPHRPRRPAWLPSKAKRSWDQVCDSLEGTGLLSEADGPALSLAMAHFVLARMAAEELAGLDSFVYVDESRQGRISKHPAHQIMRDHSASFLEYAKAFGLTPGARARLDPADPVWEDDEGFDT